MERKALIRGTHLAGLDGLRGIAVACVRLHHLSHRLFQGGYVGVDLFFVLSGFLITSLLFEEYVADGSVTLTAFYARRAKRLFPALTACIMLTCLFIVVMGHWRPLAHAGLDLTYVRRALLAAIFYLENLASPSLQNPVTHMWSLAVEEQFYIVWPVLLLVILRRAFKFRLLVTAILSGLGLSFFTLYTFVSGFPVPYASSFSRAGQLLAGATVAFLMQSASLRDRLRRPLAVGAPLALAGFLAVTQTSQVGGLVRYPPDWMFRVGFLAVTLMAMTLIAAVVVSPNGAMARVLRNPVLTRLGLISYGLYVYHWIFVFYLTPDTTNLPWLTVDVLRIALSLVVAIASYKFIELPMRRMRYDGAKRLLAPLALTTTVVASLVATLPAVGAPYGGPTPTAPVVSGALPATLDITGEWDDSDQPLRKIVIIGDVAMRRLSLPLGSALKGDLEVQVKNWSSSTWGLTAADGVTRTLADQKDNVNLTALSARVEHADLVIFSSTLGDFATVRNNQRRYETALVRLMSIIAAAPERPRIMLVLAPQVTLDAPHRDRLATSRVNAAMVRVAKRFPGQMVVVGPGVITNNASVGPTFGPPSDRPNAPTSQWVRWRAPDGVAVCQPAVVRQAAVLLTLIEPHLHGTVNATYWRGSWTTSPLFRGPTTCISDHP